MSMGLLVKLSKQISIEEVFNEAHSCHEYKNVHSHEFAYNFCDSNSYSKSKIKTENLVMEFGMAFAELMRPS